MHLGRQIDQARFSPDTRFISYNFSESGRSEVYVEPFPPTGQRPQVSSAGGVQPMWRRDGAELYYLGLDGRMFAVPMRGLAPGVPRALFQAPVGVIRDAVEQYATVDGDRFLLLKPFQTTPRPISVIVNWPSIPELRAVKPSQ